MRKKKKERNSRDWIAALEVGPFYGMAGFFQQGHQVPGLQKHCGGIFVGVHADEAAFRGEIRIQKQGDLPGFVVEQAQGRDGAGSKPQFFLQFLRGGKAQGAGMMRLAEGFQIYPLFAMDGNEIIIALFIIPHEEVFGVGFRVRQMELVQIRHIEHRRVFDFFIRNVGFFQKAIDGLFGPHGRGSFLNGLRKSIADSVGKIQKIPPIAIFCRAC